MVIQFILKCYCKKGLSFPVGSSSHRKHIGMSEHCLTNLNRVTPHFTSQTRVDECHKKNFRENYTAFSEKRLAICLLRPVMKKWISLIYIIAIPYNKLFTVHLIFPIIWWRNYNHLVRSTQPWFDGVNVWFPTSFGCVSPSLSAFRIITYNVEYIKYQISNM